LPLLKFQPSYKGKHSSFSSY